MVSIRTMFFAAGVLALCGCTPAFVSTWKAPDASLRTFRREGRGRRDDAQRSRATLG